MSGQAPRDGSFERPFSASWLAKYAPWPGRPNYGSPPWARTVLGSAIHNWFDRMARVYWAGESMPSVDWLPEIYRQEVKRVGEVRYGKEQTADSMVAIGTDIIEQCAVSMQNLLESGEVIGSEVAFRFPLGDYWYDGSIDLLMRFPWGIGSFDWKSGKRFEQEKYVGGAHPQPHLYALGVYYSVDLSPHAEYETGHRLVWPTAQSKYIAEIKEWPAFTYWHLTPTGAIPIPAIMPPMSPRIASELLIHHYTNQVVANQGELVNV